MGKLKRYSSNMFTFITVDLVEQQVVDAGFGFPRMFHSSAKRGEEEFEAHVIAAFYTLKETDVIELRKFAKTDGILKKAFKEAYQRKLVEISAYEVD